MTPWASQGNASRRATARCKAYWAGSDMMVVLLAGGFSVAEQTLFEAGRGAAVQESRMALKPVEADSPLASSGS